MGAWATDKIIVVSTAGYGSSLLYYPNFTLLPQSALRVLPRRAPNLAWKDLGVILTVQPGRATAVVPLPTPVHSRITLAVSVHPRPEGVAASGSASRSTLKVSSYSTWAVRGRGLSSASRRRSDIPDRRAGQPLDLPATPTTTTSGRASAHTSYCSAVGQTP